MQVPPNLKNGDFVGVVASGRAVEAENTHEAVRFFSSCGWRTKTGYTIGEKHYQLGGTEKERIDDFNRMLADPEIRAIFITRGGFGHLNIVDEIDWGLLKKDPKWICGFSDVTVLISHINQNLNMQALHCSMPFQWGNPDFHQKNLTSITSLLAEESIQYAWEGTSLNDEKISGQLIGGNLSVLHCLTGSSSFPDFEDKILFIEEVDEYLYHIDRMLVTMKRTGKLKKLKAILAGYFTEIKDHEEPFGADAKEIITKHATSVDIPVFWGFPAGHHKQNYALPMGADVEILRDGKQNILNIFN